ncbi:unnamed protein product [Paramecium pentaurelia]|uniref:Uncharacterized protein n=1 Tax=Paramecium pentaurelia TaxID=43138 RepID=A0A8S1YNL6_9CILI|nr:unnamed protein product [Paramecium pentaurelia]
MSDDERLSLHSYDPLQDGNDNDEIDEFYKELSYQFYGEEKKKKVSLLMSGSTQETNKPSRDTLPDVKKGFLFVKSSSSRAGSPKCGRNQVQRKSPNQKLQSSPTTIRMIQTKKLIQLLQSPYNMKNKQKQTFLKKQIDMIKKIQVQELKEHYYK